MIVPRLHNHCFYLLFEVLHLVTLIQVIMSWLLGPTSHSVYILLCM